VLAALPLCPAAHLCIGQLAPAGPALLGGAAAHALADAAPGRACREEGDSAQFEGQFEV
jgi:hypothetical protein